MASPTSTRTRTPAGAGALGLLALVVAVALAAVNLRPAIVAIGPLADRIQTSQGLGAAQVSLLTTLPLVCLGVFAAAGVPIARRIGYERGVLLAVVLVLGGSVLRLAVPTSALFAGSVIAGCGIALGNVLVPALVKRHFAEHLGAMMALHSVMLQLGATLASGLTVPIADGLGLGWRPALAVWAVPAVVAVVAWLPWAVRGTDHDRAAGVRRRVWRSGLGWAGAAFIGIQSAVFFSLSAWLPTLLQDAGLTAGRAGLMLSVVALTGIVGGLPVPLLATRMRHGQGPLVVIVCVAFAVGLLGLLLAPTGLVVLWAVVLGLAQGAGLSLALTLFTLRGRTADAAAQLAGAGQTAGYLVAAIGPLAVGYLQGATGGWTVPLLVLLVALVPLTASGLAAARPRFLEDEAEVVR